MAAQDRHVTGAHVEKAEIETGIKTILFFTHTHTHPNVKFVALVADLLQSLFISPLPYPTFISSL